MRKKNIIANLIREYDVQLAEDIQEALKDPLGGTLQTMFEVEMDNNLGYAPYERTDKTNSRNGKGKRL